MSRHLFGGVADYVISVGTANAATLQPGATVTCWNMAVGGIQYTDLTQTDGTTPIAGGELITDSAGAVPEFYGPDNVRSLYYDANSGSGPRRRAVATDIGEDLTATEQNAVQKSIVTTTGDILVATGASQVGRLPVGSAGQILAADPLESNRLRWGNGWRRRDLPDPVLADTQSAETPTVTLTQQSTSTIASAQPLLPPDTGPFLYLGAGSFQFGTVFPDTTLYLPTSRYPNTYSSGQNNWSLEFMTDASVFEVLFKCTNTSNMYRMTVDGRKVTDLAQAAGATAAGSRHVLKFNFGTSKPRRIRLDFIYMPFGGVFLPPGASAWKPTPRGGRLGVLGDSISDGSDQNTAFGIGTWFYRAARALGCTDAWDQSRGGTGYITPGSWATLGDRVASDITPYGFDRLIVWAGYNDNLGDQAAIQSAAEALYANLKTACLPGADIYVVGCWSPTGSPAGSITNTDNSIKAAALNSAVPFVSPLSGSVYDRAGNLVTTQGAWITAANAAGFIGADGVHPNDNGHIYLGRRIVEALRALMPA